MYSRKKLLKTCKAFFSFDPHVVHGQWIDGKCGITKFEDGPVAAVRDHRVFSELPATPEREDRPACLKKTTSSSGSAPVVQPRVS